jgi:hypothetical protein
MRCTLAGRRQFIPCLEGMLARRLVLLPGGEEFLNEQGEFEIHAFFEGTRNNTIGPVARESVNVVSNNLSTFAWLYGAKSIAAAFDLLKNGSDLQAALEEPAIDEALQAQLEGVDTEELSDYLIVELKERDAYKAAGYQRAFNFASVVATALGWSAYGIHHRKSQDYQFLGHFFGEVIDQNFSASHLFTELEEEVFMSENGHLLASTCFQSGASPVRIIQWGHRADAYLIYEGGEFDRSQAGGLISFIQGVPILPDPPSCD